MRRITVVLLGLLLALSIILAGDAGAKAVSGQSNPGTFGVSFPGSGTDSGNTLLNIEGTGKSAPFPSALLTSRVNDPVPQPCWVRLTRFQGQFNGIARSGHETWLIASSGSKLVPRCRQPEDTDSAGNLSSLSPPALVLRL